MKGAYEVSSDTCLYVESFTLRVINSSVTPESSRDTALKAANYYFGFHDIPDHLVSPGGWVGGSVWVGVRGWQRVRACMHG